jgi:hypothetical protein
MYRHDDPAFQIAYQSTVDNGVHMITVRARTSEQARDEFEMRAAPGATVLGVRAA